LISITKLNVDEENSSLCIGLIGVTCSSAVILPCLSNHIRALKGARTTSFQFQLFYYHYIYRNRNDKRRVWFQSNL